MQIKIAALIINWNGALDTLELLQSLCNVQSTSILITAVVIDNASSVDDRSRLKAGLDDLRGNLEVLFRANEVNIGVPAAYNQGIQIAGLTYDYYLRLDNDVVVQPQGIAAMVNALEKRKHEGIAIVGGNTKSFDNPPEDNGGAVSIDLVKGVTTLAYPAEDCICDGVQGCIMLLSGDLVRRYTPGVFEDLLFICTDESELSLRASKHGMRTLYIADFVGFHKGGRSTSKVSFLSTYYSSRNWTLHRLRYVNNARQRMLVLLRIPIDLARSVVRRRWAFPLGLFAGLALMLALTIDRYVRRMRS